MYEEDWLTNADNLHMSDLVLDDLRFLIYLLMIQLQAEVDASTRAGPRS